MVARRCEPDADGLRQQADDGCLIVDQEIVFVREMDRENRVFVVRGQEYLGNGLARCQGDGFDLEELAIPMQLQRCESGVGGGVGNAGEDGAFRRILGVGSYVESRDADVLLACACLVVDQRQSTVLEFFHRRHGAVTEQMNLGGGSILN